MADASGRMTPGLFNRELTHRIRLIGAADRGIEQQQTNPLRDDTFHNQTAYTSYFINSLEHHMKIKGTTSIGRMGTSGSRRRFTSFGIGTQGILALVKNRKKGDGQKGAPISSPSRAISWRINQGYGQSE